MNKKSKLADMAQSSKTQSNHGVIKLLISDHKLMRKLMSEVKSKKASRLQVIASFSHLVKVIQSHVKAEEKTFLAVIKDHKRFQDAAFEGYEEHRVHEIVLKGVRAIRSQKRKIEQMKIFCEILEHHLDEEEEVLFPRFKKFTASSTGKKIGAKFLKTRVQTTKKSSREGALRFASQK